MNKIINLLYKVVFLVPFVFLTTTTELFETNKQNYIYIISILIGLTWLVKNTKEKASLKHIPLLLPLLVFLFSQLLATLNSLDTYISLTGAPGRLNGGFFSLLSFSLLYFGFVTNINATTTKKILSISLISLLTLTLWGIFEHSGRSPSCLLVSSAFNTNCWQQNLQQRVFATLGQPNWFAAYLVSLAPLLWYKTYKKSNRKKVLHTLTPVFLQALLFICLLFTGSRSGMLAYILSISLFIIISTKQKSAIKKHTLAIVLTVIMLTPLILRQTNTSSTDQIQTTPTTTIRLLVWEAAINAWREKPLLGYGPETFSLIFSKYKPEKHNLTTEWSLLYNKAHNEYLNILTSSGLIGLSAYLFLIFGMAKLFWKSIKTSTDMRIHLALFTGWVSILITNFFGFSTVTTNTFLFLFPALSYSLAAKNRSTKKTPAFSPLIPRIFLYSALTALLFTSLIFTIRFWLADYYNANGVPQKAVSLNPYEPFYRTTLARIKAEHQPSQEFAAIKELEYALNLSPNNPKVYKDVIAVYSLLSLKNSAYTKDKLAIQKKLETLAPKDPAVFYSLALTYYQLKDTQKAKEYLQQALNLKPNYEEALDFKNVLMLP